MNFLTSLLSSVSNILLLGHPTRTALGFVFGISIKIILKILSSTTNSNIDLQNITDWEFGILGIFILHIPTIGYYLFKREGMLSEDEEKAFAAIRELNITEYEKQPYYAKLVEKFIEKIEINYKTRNEINRLPRYPWAK